MSVIVTTAQAAPGPPGPQGQTGTGNNDGPGILFLNVMDAPYSAKGDGQYGIVTANSGTAALTFSSITFTNADVGKAIVVVRGGTLASYGTTSGGLSTGGAITSLPVNSLAAAVPGGIVTIVSGTHAQDFRTDGAAMGATSIIVDSQTPNFAYPSSSTVGLAPNLVTTIASVAAGVPTLTAAPGANVPYNAGVTNCIWGTDDTVAIQAAIDACIAAGGGTVYFPCPVHLTGGSAAAGYGASTVYVIAGALKTSYHGSALPANGYTFNTQLAIYDTNLTSVAKPSIKLIGERPIATTDNDGAHRSGSIIQSIINGSGTEPALLGGPLLSLVSYVHVDLRISQLRFCQPPNPSLTSLHLHSVETAAIDEVMIDTTDPWSAIQQPTNPAGRGLLMPGQGCYLTEHIRDVVIQGYYSALQPGEHTVGDQIQINSCVVGLVPSVNIGLHGCYFSRISIAWSGYFIAYSDPATGVGTLSAGAQMDIGVLDIEDGQDHGAPLWEQAVAHIHDPSSNLKMNICVRNEGVTFKRFLFTGANQVNWWFAVGTAAPVLIGAAHPITFSNSWGQSGGNQTQVYVDRAGIVHLEGQIAGGASGTIAFNLPRPFRPDHTVTREGLDFAAGKFTQVSIAATGDVTCNLQAGATVVDLEGIAFRSADRAQ